MFGVFNKILCFSFIFILAASIRAQNRDDVDVFLLAKNNNFPETCRQFKFSEIVLYTPPIYPKQAKSAGTGGAVEMSIVIGEKGELVETEKVTGNEILQAAASAAAKRIKFTPALCDNEPKPVEALLVYNFVPNGFSEKYFTPAIVGDFNDLKPDSQYFEPISFLIEKNRLAFGYADKNFHAEAPLLYGDFAHFLRKTLDLLHNRAAFAKKNPQEINLYAAYNPNNLTSAGEIVNLKKNQPFADAVKTLFSTYRIALADKNNEFHGRKPMTNNEIIKLWTEIFGAEAIPVNFHRTEDDRLLTRGEFALFLRESLEVLIYKVTP